MSHIAHRVGFLQWMVCEAREPHAHEEPRLYPGRVVSGPFITRGIAMRTAQDIDEAVRREHYDTRRFQRDTVWLLWRGAKLERAYLYEWRAHIDIDLLRNGQPLSKTDIQLTSMQLTEGS